MPDQNVSHGWNDESFFYCENTDHCKNMISLRDFSNSLVCGNFDYIYELSIQIFKEINIK